MTIREKIEKQTGHYSRDLKIASVMLVLGTIGVIVLLCFDPFAKGDQGNPVWKIICVGSCAVLYGLGQLGVCAFTMLHALTAKCPTCGKRFRALRKDWRFCPFCGIDFSQPLEEGD
jgi:hypothetical protein